MNASYAYTGCTDASCSLYGLLEGLFGVSYTFPWYIEIPLFLVMAFGPLFVAYIALQIFVRTFTYGAAVGVVALATPVGRLVLGQWLIGALVIWAIAHFLF